MPDVGDTPAIVVIVAGDGTERVVGRLDACRPGLALVDALLRLQLAARRRGGRVCVRGATAQLGNLLDFAGLAGLLVLEPWRQAEGGEQLGVDEVVQPADPPV